MNYSLVGKARVAAKHNQTDKLKKFATKNSQNSRKENKKRGVLHKFHYFCVNKRAIALKNT